MNQKYQKVRNHIQACSHTFLAALAVCVMGTGIFSMSLPDVSITASADEFVNYGNLCYQKHDNYVEVISCNDQYATEIDIPSEIDGLPVTSLGSYIF